MRAVGMWGLFTVVALVAGAARSVVAQEPEPATREAAIEQEQAEKVKVLRPYVPGKFEGLMNRAEEILVNGVPRWHPYFESADYGGEYSDPMAEKYLADVLIKRRDKIMSTYLPAVNPIVAPRLDANGRLTFENAAAAARVANGPATYRASWLRFDNATGETQAISETQSATTTIEAPQGLPTASGSFVAVDISVDSEGHPTWRRPVRTHFRREGNGWKLVGLERLPESRSTDSAAQSPKGL